MYRNATVGVVVPAYNEEGFVGEVLRNIPDYVDSIYAINDRSTDGTLEEIREAAGDIATRSGTMGARTPLKSGEHPPSDASQVGREEGLQSVADLFRERVADCQCRGKTVIIDHAENFGAGGSIKTGYLAALLDDVDIVVTIDADGQMDPKIMDRLIDPVVDGTAEYAKGTRMLDGKYREKMPLIRTVGNTALTYLTKVACGYWKVTDSQNGYTAITRSALLDIEVEDLFEYYAYCNAVLARLNANDITIADVEVPIKYGDEESDIEYGTFIFKVVPMLIRNFLWRIRQKYLVSRTDPIGIAFLAGAFFPLFGVIGAVYAHVKGKSGHNGKSLIASVIFGTASTLLAVLQEGIRHKDLVTVVTHEEEEGDTMSSSATAPRNRTP